MLRFAFNSFSFSTPLLTGLLSLSLLSGCAAQRIANEDSVSQATTEKVSELGNDSERALSQAKAAYATASSEDLSFYAPLHMEQIQQALKQARSHELAGDAQASIESSARVLSLLDSALKNKARAQSALSPLFAQKAVLDEIKAGSVMSARYQREMKELRSLISMIEAGESDKVIDKSAGVLKSLQQLELDTMLRLHWQPANETLEKADDEDADTHAPATFSDAELQVEKAAQTIRRHYQDRALTESTGKEALRAAQHALYIAREAKNITRLDSAQAEQAALEFEGYLHQLSMTLGAGDMRHMALKDQTLAIVQYAEEQARRNAAQQTTSPNNSATAIPEAASPVVVEQPGAEAADKQQQNPAEDTTAPEEAASEKESTAEPVTESAATETSAVTTESAEEGVEESAEKEEIKPAEKPQAED
ncbi:hypothetical protein [Thalassolituus sp. UBA2009]|uniref:hypothetical protein n=1 Tax=Thalassolituus sp. UBA2009 TaxID=1947658 RepID=UPI00257F9DBE|nr:hypothetical protein [Thalassolituus sp. UBA2009]